MRLVTTSFILLALTSIQATGAEKPFDKMPPGWSVGKAIEVEPERTKAIGNKFGAPIKRLTNTFLSVQGRAIQVNILEAEDEDGAAILHNRLRRIKMHPAFCVKDGLRVIEYTGRNIKPSLAMMVSYELGFIKKPSEMKYRIYAEVALIDKADYMSLNELFNLFLILIRHPGDKKYTTRIDELRKKIQFGNTITVRTPFRFIQKPTKQEKSPSGGVTYSFEKPPTRFGIPYATIKDELIVPGNGYTRTTRKADKALTAPTEFWPADDPEIIALAKKITDEHEKWQDKATAILKWLKPGVNIKFGGEVTGSRWGVKKVLQQKFGYCWDFSDCYITLCRAIGIPCRQVGGWLYGTSGHVWVEVLLDGKGWMQVDPTGGGLIRCGIYHVPYFVSEDGKMPILYVSMPRITTVGAK